MVHVSTAEVRARLGRQTVSEEAIGIAFGVLALALVLAKAFRLGDVPAVETFALVLVSIVVEALPFILVGAFVSAALAAFVPERAFARVARLPRAVQLPCAAVGAFAFPVCDCGTVPVARRLLMRGLDPAASLAFMLAAPVVNPLVLGSTWVAYGGGRRGLEIAAARACLALVTAIVAGLALARVVKLRADGRDADANGHSHEHSLDSFGIHLTHDFLSMGRFIVVGASLAAFLQVAVPQASIAQVAATPVVAELALMAIAFALSLCSEADAFVAASFGAFGIGPQLAFLVLGPLADAKLSVLYGATFRRLFAVRLLAVVVPAVLVGSLLAGRVLG
jgi:uncharacterized membrane protein YraQ (UPF0718 family)